MSRAAFARVWADPSVSTAAFGAMLGITGAAVRWRAQAYGLPPRAVGPVRGFDLADPLWREMFAANVRASEIGGYFGVAGPAIAHAARQLGLERNCNRYSAIGLAAFWQARAIARMQATMRAEQTRFAQAGMVDITRPDAPRRVPRVGAGVGVLAGAVAA